MTFPLPAGLDPATTVIIAEKTSQAKDLQAALGSNYGRILAAEGHLIELAEPDDVDPNWKTWDATVLRPASGRYPLRAASGGNKGSKLQAIKQALSKATGVIIATDCDREGQLIGQEILEFSKFKGKSWRAIFTAQDPKTLQQAFAQLQPNSAFQNMYDSAVARQQADQIFNLSLTRTATTQLRDPGARGVIGVGRVKAPTLGIVCKRELEIRNFVPVDYFEITAIAKLINDRQITMRYAPKARILERTRADAVAAYANQTTGPLVVTVEDKRKGPPKLFDLPALQKTCASRWSWTAAKTLEIAQALYDGDGKKILTYPRAEARYLSENQIADVPVLLGHLGQLKAYTSLIPSPPVVRKGKTGTFSDAALKGVSHHAIIPNVNTTEDLATIWPKLSKDEQLLFDLIAKSYVASLSPDYEYRQTVATRSLAPLAPLPETIDFQVRGAVPLVLGWKAVFATDPKDKTEPSDKNAEAAANDDGEEIELPPLTDGEAATLTEPTVDAKQTQPPPRYNEGGLISAMQDAWRFVDDPALRDRLKDAKGIGTPATRAEVIEGLKRQKFLQLSGKHIVPTEGGLDLYQLLAKTAPAVVDPGTTAQWELRLDAVNLGAASSQDVIDEISDAAGRIIKDILTAAASGQRLVSRGGVSGGGDGPPTPKMLALAKKIAKERKLKIPKETQESFGGLRTWLDTQMGGSGPSDKQVAFAQRIATASGVAIPAATLSSGKELRTWLEANAPAQGSDLPPTTKQLAFLEELAGRLGETVPDAAKASAKATSALIDAWMPRANALKTATQKQIDFAHALASSQKTSVPSEALATATTLSAWISAHQGTRATTSKTCPRCGVAKLDTVTPPTGGAAYYSCAGQGCGFTLPVGAKARKAPCPTCQGVVLERHTKVTEAQPTPRPYWACAKCTWRGWPEPAAATA